jgi:hypothetical protein
MSLMYLATTLQNIAISYGVDINERMAVEIALRVEDKFPTPPVDDAGRWRMENALRDIVEMAYIGRAYDEYVNAVRQRATVGLYGGIAAAPPTYKFKLGDRVRHVQGHADRRTGIIEKIGEAFGAVIVQWGDESLLRMLPSELELVPPFKTGDRVRHKESGHVVGTVRDAYDSTVVVNIGHHSTLHMNASQLELVQPSAVEDEFEAVLKDTDAHSDAKVVSRYRVASWAARLRTWKKVLGQ